MSYRMYIDDVRKVPTSLADYDKWVLVRNMDEALAYIRENGAPEFISFDHDLGYNEPTGYDFAKKLVEMDIDVFDDFEFPEDFKYCSHSMNPVGKRNILMYLDGYFRVKEGP